MSRNNARIWIVCSILLSVLVAPFLVRGDQQTESQLEENRAQIGRMTQSERDRLERNFQAYRAMDSQQRQSISDFHEKLNQDQSHSAGELNAALIQYREWLNTIEPFQRDQLRTTSNPQQRLKLMEEIVKDQRMRDAVRVLREWLKNDSELLKRSPLAKVPILDSEDLSRLMSGIEGIEWRRLSQEQQSELNRHDGIKRFVVLLEILKRNQSFRPADRTRGPRWGVRELFATFEKTAERFDEFVEDERARQFVHGDDDEESKLRTTLRVQSLLLMSMMMQVMGEKNDSSIPTQQQLEQIFSSLPQEEQDRLLQLEAIDFYKELVSRMEPANESEDRLSLRDVGRAFLPPWEDGGRRPPPGGRGPGNPRDGEENPPRGEMDDRDGFRGDRSDRDGRPFGGRIFQGRDGDRNSDRPPEPPPEGERPPKPPQEPPER